MPLYEYECDACGRRFERIQKFSDPLATVCPTCGGAVRKLFSSPAIKFKGSGFYITDYAKSGASGSEADKTDKSDKSDKKSADPAPSSSGDSGDAKAKPAAGADGASGDSAKKAEPAKAPASSNGKTKT
jgi:putative FmdB family regulatory protein